MQSSVVPKEKVREYLQERSRATTPPESPERIREKLGWGLIEAERQEQQKR